MPSVAQPDRILRVITAAAFALMATFAAVMTMPRPVAACSCVGFTTLKEAVAPDNAGFAGTAGMRQARGVPVQVAEWFWGRGAAPTVWLASSSFGDDGMCGIAAPPPGSSWLWVGYAAENGDFGTGLCAPAGDLGTPEGQAMLAEARRLTAGEAVPPDPSAGSTSEAALPTPATSPAESARDQAAIAILGALLLGSLALFGGIVLIARRSRLDDRG